MSALQYYVDRKCSFPFLSTGVIALAEERRRTNILTPSTYLSSASVASVEQVLVVTQDGRVIVGTLKGCDALGSIILAGSVERIFSSDEGVEEVALGLYVMRGDSICLVGQLDQEKDKSIDLSNLMAEPIPETRHA
ncbi:hypothetical protein BCV70DRAFT_161650 [Testicularia cyperi]|uniref:LSM2-LSM8 complex subunit LSM8 n=1 Tax=Testicularia cyperi TaxID=1882483 RepID=A0A317XQU3_9BASI|nr:hypothetical protein BCV70DRAFT_161650 [Testicularia cyperi]